MAADFVFGLAALLLARRRLSSDASRTQILVRIALVCFAAACLLGQLGYLAFGLHAAVGDPANLVQRLGLITWREMASGRSHAWIPFALALPAVGVVIMRTYFPLQQRLLPGRTMFERVVVTTKTLGVVVGCFCVLALTVGRMTDSTGLEKQASETREQAARSLRVVTAARAVRAEMEGRPKAEIDAAVEQRVLKVIDEPIPAEEKGTMVPIAALAMLALVLAGALTVATDRRRPLVSTA
jgi:hypothetical protein